MRKEILHWARTCVPRQRSKVQRHTRSAIGKFDMPDNRFDHVHIDIVGPLPPSQGNSYILTMIDRFSRWPEAVPLPEITADVVATVLYDLGHTFRNPPQHHNRSGRAIRGFTFQSPCTSNRSSQNPKHSLPPTRKRIN